MIDGISAKIPDEILDTQKLPKNWKGPFEADEIEKIEDSFPAIIQRTALEFHRGLSFRYGCNVYLKREDRQVVRSYKIRGAFNAISKLSAEEKRKGVVCASAGNHSQGVALACKYLKVKGVIFMPKTTPMQKIDKTKKFGGKWVEVKLVGDSFDEACVHAMKYCSDQGSRFIHPFDDIETIKGQATVGVEILRKMNGKGPIDYLVVPIGGGGLVSGVGAYFKEKSPETKIIGVEPAGAPAMYDSLKAGKLVCLDKVDKFVDGAAVSQVGKNTFEIAQKVVDRVLKAPEGRICSSILEFLQEDGVVVEPAGILSVDALKDLKDEIKGKTVVCLLSGSNLDFSRLPEIKERSLRFEGLKKYYVIKFAQRTGALREFLDLLGDGDDIVRFEYMKKSDKERGPAFIGIESNKKENFSILQNRMQEKDIVFEDVTDNEFYFDLLV